MTLRSGPILQGHEAPRVVTTAMLATALSGNAGAPSRPALFNWIAAKEHEGSLVRLSRGTYLNRLAIPPTQPEEAAGHIRSGAVVSLQKVLGDAGVTNNYTSVITCVVPWMPGSVPRVGRVKARSAEFHFHAMPSRIVSAGSQDDRLQSGVWHARATPERALLDWIHLGHSGRSSIAPPPYDTNLDRLDLNRLNRLAKAMGMVELLKSYRERHSAYAAAPEVQANASMDFSL